MSLNYLSVCSGIESATVAWRPLGFQALAFAEIEPFPCHVLSHHYPAVPNLGDIRSIDGAAWRGPVDILVGGTPCQSFSVAGRRDGLSDDRGNLALAFVELADAVKPSFILWENVPGVLSSKDNSFGCFLGRLAGESLPLEPPGGRWADSGCVFGPERTVAWRCLDAQYFGLAQRRKRVFVVGCPTTGANSIEVLFEFKGVRRDTAPGRGPQADVAGTLKAGARSGGWGNSADYAAAGYIRSADRVTQALTARFGSGGPDDNKAQGGFYVAAAYGGGNTGGEIPVATAISSHGGRMDFDTETFVAHTLRGEGYDASEDGTGRQNLVVSPQRAMAFTERTRDDGRTLETQDDLAYALTNPGSGGRAHSRQILDGFTGVRRLTPVECERLMGFPDGYTDIPGACDSARYKALGNSMAVPVMRWIGKRILMEIAHE
jgi:DNA (cytosine-5)-methyltransferase 1